MSLEPKAQAFGSTGSPAAPLIRPCHLAAWLGLALQPLFDLLGRNPEFLLAHALAPTHVVALAALLGVGLPWGVAGIQAWVGHWRPKLGEAWAALSLVGAGTALLLPWLKRWPGWAGPATLGLALVGGALLWRALATSAPLRQFSAVLAPTGLLLAVHFLAWSPARHLLVGADPPAATPSPTAALGRQIPIVVLVFDEFPTATLMSPDGQIDAKSWPNFARLARQATWYPNASTVASDTTFAVPAMLSGRYPDRFRLATARDYPENLLSFFGGGGYLVRAEEAGTHLCEAPCQAPKGRRDPQFVPAALGADLGVIVRHLWLPADWTRDLPPIDASWRDFRGTDPGAQGSPSGMDPLSALERFLAELRPREPGARGQLHLLHVFLPHVPWRFLPSGQGYGPIGLSIQPLGAGPRWTNDPWPVAQAWQRHLLQARFVDALLGRVLDRLEELGWLEEAALVLVADHGTAFEPGQPRRRPTELNLGEIAAVPLFYKSPGQKTGHVDLRDAETVDILPTLAEAVEARIPFELDGVSLMGPALARSQRQIRRTNDTEIGEAISFSTATLVEQRQAAVLRREAYFPKGEVYALQVAPPWLGRSAAGWPPQIGLSASLEQPHQFDAVDPSGEFLPTHVRFELHGDGGSPSEVGRPFAIAVNGRFVATSRSVADGERRLVAAMVEPGHFISGKNAVELFALDLASQQAAQVATSSAIGPKLAGDLSQVELPGEAPRRLERLDPPLFASLRRNPLGGSVEILPNVAEGRGIRRVLLFEGRTYVLSLDPEPSSPANAGGEPEKRRFFLRIPDRLARHPESLQLVALTDDRAFEIVISLAR